MAILKTDKTNYYELDWDVPTEKNKKVYIAIKGDIQKGTSMFITADRVGYEWREDEKSKIKQVSEKEFLEKVADYNVVYFENSKYNELLDYPKEIQKKVDIELFAKGDKPHHRISILQKMRIRRDKAKGKIKNKIIIKNTPIPIDWSNPDFIKQRESRVERENSKKVSVRTLLEDYKKYEKRNLTTKKGREAR